MLVDLTYLNDNFLYSSGTSVLNIHPFLMTLISYNVYIQLKKWDMYPAWCKYGHSWNSYQLACFWSEIHFLVSSSSCIALTSVPMVS